MYNMSKEVEELLKQFTIKEVNPDNPTVVRYRLVNKHKKRTWNIYDRPEEPVELPQPPKQKRRAYNAKYLQTPLGVFLGRLEAAKAHNITPATMSTYLNTRSDKFYYIEDKEKKNEDPV
jgi:hypothetical protein